MYELFEKLLKANNTNAFQVSKKLGISVSTLYDWKNGRSKPKADKLKKIADYFNVPVSYLMGELETEGFDILPDDALPIAKRKIPILGSIACGSPIMINEEFETYIFTEADITADYALIAKGDSMTGARIFDGDLVFIRKQSIVLNGEIAAVAIDDEVTLKRVYYYPEENLIKLLPENPAYRPMVFSGIELDRINILGKAVFYQSMVR